MTIHSISFADNAPKDAPRVKCGKNSPEKQSIRDAIEHLLARYLEIRPLFLAPARPINVEWKMRPYFGVFPRVFNALNKIE